jgi:tRNA threonylcarbamoyladenosine biosynthesis protein TsaB
MLIILATMKDLNIASAGCTTLGIETSTSYCAAALLRGDLLLAESGKATDRRHNETLPGIIQELLRETGVSWQDLGLIAVSIGPGSFTGLRVGLSFAKGVAVGLGIPLVPVGSLEALAHHFADSAKAQSPESKAHITICPLIPARKGEAFGQLFEITDSEIVSIGEPFLADAKEARRILVEGVQIFGEGAEMLLPLNQNDVRLDSDATANVLASAEAVARLGFSKWRDAPDSIPPLVALEPRYLKEFTITKARQG